MINRLETPLEMAKRHVVEQEARIAKQRNLIARLRATDLPTEAATQLLETMKEMLACFVENYEGISRAN